MTCPPLVPRPASPAREASEASPVASPPAAAGPSGDAARCASRPLPVPLRHVEDAGMATAEYAIATLAACGFAALLLALMRSDEVRDLLYDVIRRALALG